MEISVSERNGVIRYMCRESENSRAIDFIVPDNSGRSVLTYGQEVAPKPCQFLACVISTAPVTISIIPQVYLFVKYFLKIFLKNFHVIPLDLFCAKSHIPVLELFP